MSATILPFRPPAASDERSSQPLAPVAANQAAGALSPAAEAAGLSPAQELYMDAYLERAIGDAHRMLLKASTPEGQTYWFEAMKRLCKLRSVRRIAALERAKQPR